MQNKQELDILKCVKEEERRKILVRENVGKVQKNCKHL
jgi:hypothetical protein